MKSKFLYQYDIYGVICHEYYMVVFLLLQLFPKLIRNFVHNSGQQSTDPSPDFVSDYRQGTSTRVLPDGQALALPDEVIFSAIVGFLSGDEFPFETQLKIWIASIQRSRVVLLYGGVQ